MRDRAWILGLLALWLGQGMLEAFGTRLESVAGILLVGFGLAYVYNDTDVTVNIKVYGTVPVAGASRLRRAAGSTLP